MAELDWDDEEWPELPLRYWQGTWLRKCAMCSRSRWCTLVADIQPGFPEGEWMCRECL